MSDNAPVRFVYFAWVREMVGTSDEEIALPQDVQTVGDLAPFLARRSEGHAEAMAHASSIRFALDQEAAEPGDRLAGTREVAIFPPMTGG